MVGLLALTLSCCGPAVPADGPPGATHAEGARCEGPDAGPWVREIHDRVLATNALAIYATERYGPPLACEGSVTMEFDGVEFGTLRLNFAEGVSFQVDTMPPEASVVTLARAGELASEAEGRRVLEAYTSRVGVSIDWTSPTESNEGAEQIITYWDPTPGLNASASLSFLAGTLVAIRFSMAP